MRFPRKIFASDLRQSGAQPEVADLLQGMVAQSVLTRHYLVPKSYFKEDVLESFKNLKQEIEQW